MNDQSLEVDQSSPNENRPHRPLKKPYKELNLAEKVELIRLAEDNVGLSQATIAERYSIAKSNVCRILQRKREYLKAFESSGFAASRKRKLKCRSTEPVDIGSSQSIIHAPIPLRPYDSNGNETLRAHMYKEHEVSRMFMCRCCNWAFPDKTSLHVHIQSKEEAKRSSLHSIPSISNGLPSAFAPLHSSLNSSPLPVLPMPFPPPAVLPQSDLLSHLKDRLLLNSLLTFPPSFSFPFLPPSTLLSTNEDKSPSSEMKEEEEDEDEEIEVRDTHEDGETPSKKMHLQPKSPVSRQSSLSEKRPDSPCDTSGSSSSVFSPSHNDQLLSPSPSDRQKELLPSLNLDPSHSSSFSVHPHVSPSETHSTVSPQCESSHSCFDCNLLRARILSQDNKISFLESRLSSSQNEMSSTLTSLRVAESTVISLRSALLSCQEEALRFARCENAADSQAVMRFLNQILQSTIIR
ncbi:hypothetical protein PENTCL1PPCAC_11418 [Pristionchus entomophagus]|uniref:HTH psq-type domain-containing protein n=1 Tax=Pristionchus entomophagus TaxID=358040 RepID=A0AAV5T4Y3_9BILA|nr:hypothetical protein PENTCL1PPCAC_11418 [Pristionchus entomophagus]